MELLLIQNQLLIWASKPCKVSGYSCSPDPPLVHCLEHKTVLLTKTCCYYIHIAKDWFYLYHNSSLFNFFVSYLVQQTICIAEKTGLTPLILYSTVFSRKHKEKHLHSCAVPSQSWTLIRRTCSIIYRQWLSTLPYSEKGYKAKEQIGCEEENEAQGSLLNRKQRTVFKGCAGRS